MAAHLFRRDEEVLLRGDLDPSVEIEGPRVQLLIPGRAERFEHDHVGPLLKQPNGGPTETPVGHVGAAQYGSDRRQGLTGVQGVTPTLPQRSSLTRPTQIRLHAGGQACPTYKGVSSAHSPIAASFQLSE